MILQHLRNWLYVIPNLLPGGSMNLSKIYSNCIKMSHCAALLFCSTAAAVPVDLYVANNKGSSVTIINTANQKSLSPPNSPVTVGNGPSNIAIVKTSNGVYAYVTNYNDNTVSVINTANYDLVTTIKSDGAVTFDAPNGIAATPDGALVYVTNYGNGDSNGHITIINTANNIPEDIIDVGRGPSGIAIATISNGVVYAYVANIIDSTVSIINTIAKSVSTVNVSLSPSDVAITPDGKYVYVVSVQQETDVNVINTSSNLLETTISVNEGALKGIAITPDGKYAYVGSINTSDSGLSIIDTSSNTVTSRIKIADGNSGPNSVTITPDGLWAYVTNVFNNNVSVVSIKTQGLENTINNVFNFPTGIAFAPPPPAVILTNSLQQHTRLRTQY